MLEFDPSALQPGEIGFCLRTNHLVTAGRFADFLRAFGRTETAGRLPRHDIEIVALATGSIFGKVRVRFQHDVGSPDVGHARAELERVANRSPDRATEILASIDQKVGAIVDEAKVARRGGVEAKWTARAALVIAAAALVNDLAADARSEDTTNPSAVLVADMIEHDGVSDIDLWCDGCHLSIGRNDVPAYVERQEGVIRRPVGRADERDEGLALPVVEKDRSDLAGAIADAGLGNGVPFPTSAHFSSGADVPAYPPVDPAEIFNKSAPRTIAVERTGQITIAGDLLVIENETGADRQKPAIIVPPGSYSVRNGQTATVRGKLFRLLGPQDLIIAETVINADGDSAR